jgi:two-component system sensor histidine kinase UhpB
VSLTCPDDVGRWEQHVEATIFRVVQEALTNVVKHSGASAVQLSVKRDPTALMLQIEDNGRGLQRDGVRMKSDGTEGLGFINMRERVAELHGTFAVDSVPGSGTRIEVTIPVEP